ncbi:hypothetical protein LCGC14_2933330 [marine sediment metagenome]|uniref:Uncharacterized protein n=1 Tax=marine sediment metagenome TaxID=412755 RepID=A0A0F9AB92_9ZZZZ
MNIKNFIYKLRIFKRIKDLTYRLSRFRKENNQLKDQMIFKRKVITELKSNIMKQNEEYSKLSEKNTSIKSPNITGYPINFFLMNLKSNLLSVDNDSFFVCRIIDLADLRGILLTFTMPSSDVPQFSCINDPIRSISLLRSCG